MGLSLQVATQYDTPVNYWHIAGIGQNFEQKSLAVNMAGFVSQAAREAGAQPLTYKQVMFTSDAFISDATRSAIYPALKTLPDFSGATDA